MAPVLKGKSIGSDPKTLLKGKLLIWRTKNQVRDQLRVQLKDSICFNSAQIGSLGNWTLDPCLKWALLACLLACTQTIHTIVFFFGCNGKRPKKMITWSLPTKISVTITQNAML